MQRPFHQSLVAIGPVVSEEKIVMWISNRVLCKTKFDCGGHLGRRAEPQDTFLEENHPMTISVFCVFVIFCRPLNICLFVLFYLYIYIIYC
jgi:hypothetical protein